MNHRRLGFTFAALLATGVLSGCAPKPTGPARIDSRADQALHQMSTALSDAKSFSVRSTVTMDELLASGQLAEFSRDTRILVRRPDRLAAEIHRGNDTWLLWYSGNDLTILDKNANACASVKVPGSIDDMLDEVMEKHGLAVPLADLLFADPYKVLTAEVLTGKYAGLHEVDGVKCIHLLFIQENVDWQIWIHADGPPLPAKVLIDYKTRPGRPQFSAKLREWNLSAAADDDRFKPALPENVKRVEMTQLLDGKQESK